MKIAEHSLNHSADILPKAAYLQQALEEHLQWTADHGDQQEDHCQVPAETLPISFGTLRWNLFHFV